ncbi:MAG: hypothetical protein KIG65_00480 [Eubacteriales bacterium]|nr:hypothetical protein [Eubacteriales bacterium]
MKYQPVTVFKKMDDDWKTVTFDKAYVRRIRAVSKENGGRYVSDVLSVRIFSRRAALIEPEDKIIEGSGYNAPPDDALTVSEIADNYCIKHGHFRVTAM